MIGVRAWIDRAARLSALSLALFAVLLLTNAPVRATLMLASAGDAGAICSVHQDKGGADHRAPIQQHEACAACSVCHATSLAILVDDVVVLTAATPSLIVRAIRPAIFNPRGPPVRAANARAPPSIA